VNPTGSGCFGWAIQLAVWACIGSIVEVSARFGVCMTPSELQRRVVKLAVLVLWDNFGSISVWYSVGSGGISAPNVTSEPGAFCCYHSVGSEDISAPGGSSAPVGFLLAVNVFAYQLPIDKLTVLVTLTNLEVWPAPPPGVFSLTEAHGSLRLSEPDIRCYRYFSSVSGVQHRASDPTAVPTLVAAYSALASVSVAGAPVCSHWTDMLL